MWSTGPAFVEKPHFLIKSDDITMDRVNQLYNRHTEPDLVDI
jgi:hypothetical protein